MRRMFLSMLYGLVRPGLRRLFGPWLLVPMFLGVLGVIGLGFVLWMAMRSLPPDDGVVADELNRLS